MSLMPNEAPPSLAEDPQGPPATRIAVLTSGGDAPGMNACIRAVVRTGRYRGCDVLGVIRGFWGLIDDRFEPLTSRDVGNIIHRGGTVLETSRCKPFLEPEGRGKAAENLRRHRVHGLIVIGGDGTFRGAEALSVEQGIRVVGVPGTIDNDLYGTDYTIGYDTATNTALSAIDRLRDTAFSHERLFFVEVMGRNSGFIALEAGIAGGAEDVVVPESETDVDALCRSIQGALSRGKKGLIVVVAEGDEGGGALPLAEKVKARLNMEYRVTILGHIQRGGSPTARDRIRASRLGAAAVEALLEGKDRIMVGTQAGSIVHVPLRDTFEKRKPFDFDLLRMVQMLAG